MTVHVREMNRMLVL